MNKRSTVIAVVALVVVIVIFAFVQSRESADPARFYDRSVTAPESMPEEIRENMLAQIKANIARIDANAEDFNAWYDLGVYYKGVNDYEGARLVWEHAAQIRSDSYAPRVALGDLYGFYLHDKEKAEYYYREAIKADPKQGFSYFQFAVYYRDILNDREKALQIANEGLLAIPADKDLRELRDSLVK